MGNVKVVAACAVLAMCLLVVGITSAQQGQDIDQNTNSSTTMNSNSSMNSNMSNVNESMKGNMNGNMSMGQNMNSNMGGGMMMVSSGDKKFMMTAAMGGMAEIESARLALQKSSMDSVKEYAQKMIDDHTKAGDELKALAASKGVALPTELDAKHMAMMAKMQNASGMAFDRMYVQEMGVKAHEKMEKLFRDESAKGRDADTKAFAAKTLPVVQMHLTMAREMMANMKNMKMNGNMNGNMSGMNSNNSNMR